MWFSKETFQAMIANCWIVDGRGGGLVLGRSHSDGDILMIQERNNGTFYIPACLEGGEYILNYDAYQADEERLEQINGFKEIHTSLPSIKINSKTRILNTHAEPHDKMLWIDSRGQFIVCKSATAKYLQELDELNHTANGFLSCNLNFLGPKEAT